MKIIHLLLGKANPNRMNGVNKVVFNLATAQLEIGGDAEVWGITHDPDGAAGYEHQYNLRLFKSAKIGFVIDRKLSRAIRKLNASECIFHMHGGFIPHFHTISRLLRKKGIPYIFTTHGSLNPVALKKSSYTKQLYMKLFEKTVLENAKFLHFVGKSEFESAKKFVDNSSVLIPNGQNMLETANGKCQKTEDTVPVFGFMGRITMHTKGLDILLNGFRKYKQEMNGVGQLWIVGEGADSSRLKKLVADLDIEKDVIFWGAQFDSEKLNTLSGMDAFYHTSRNEGLPGAVLEAASIGIPCVVSKETNVGDYIREAQAGIELSANNETEVAKSMAKVHRIKSDHSIAMMRENAKKMIASEFSWSKIANDFNKVYNS